jgi:hypothetical protein
MARRCKPLVLLVLSCGWIMSACSEQSPSAPTPMGPVPSQKLYSGDWEGAGRVTSCRGLTCDFRLCSNFLTAEASRRVGLTITQNTSETVGTLVNSYFFSAQDGIRIPVSGRVQDSGSLTLSGETSTGPSSTLGITTSQISLIDANALRGVFSWRVVRPFTLQVGACREDFTVDVEFLGLTRRMP